jgi:AcrR family transcriptional regulator
MSRVVQPRRHLHLSRSAIAQTALEIVDRDGLEALSLRNVAATLGVGTMTLYRYVPDRDAIVGDVVALLLSEVDTTEKPGETWDETIRRVTGSVRTMALAHPRAFELVALAPIDEPPVLDHAQTISRLHETQGISEKTFTRMWSVVDSFVTGFLLMETAEVVRLGSANADPSGDGAGRGALQTDMAQVLSAEAFEFALSVVIAGLKGTLMAGEGGSAGAAT